ncbi:MAG TPA: 7-carboxy-7-deazaguanine synthase QueE [Gammaproteobacteria bacterium]|nr:7-carboxy-7-deazaguanine synthase QueE [Gammaproteobacteria bacterium]
MSETAAARRDALPAHRRLRITEIFHSIQGEADSVGWPTVFVRLTGCPLRCGYCDTAYAFHGGEWMGFDAIECKVASYAPQYVTVTGGEPLAQKNCPALLTRLCDTGYRVSLETSGALPIAALDQRVVRVMDIKTPGSGESARNLPENIPALRAQDQVKFVLCDRADYEWACAMLHEHALATRCQVLFSPSHDQLEARDLAEWILADRVPVRLQVQLHKYLWGNVPGR